MSKITVSEAGRKGGLARKAKLTEHRRKEIAKLGYLASPISRLTTQLENKPGQMHEFPWPIDLITREAYDALSLKDKKKQAVRLFRIAMSRLGLRSPSKCSNCNLPGYNKISGHHDDYSEPMRVRFICHACHISLHRLSSSSNRSANSQSNEKIPENKVENSSCA